MRRAGTWALLAVAWAAGACAGSDGPSSTDATGDAGVDAAVDTAPADVGAPSCEARPDGSPCDDGDDCTSDDSCQGGVCAGTAVLCEPTGPCAVAACDPRFGCFETPAADGEACALPCFEAATCAAGACVPAPETALVCPPPEEPCVDHLACDATTGECSIAVRSTTGTSCDADGSVCTIEVCNEEGACVDTGQVVGCAWRATKDPCWTWVCDPLLGCAEGAFKDGATCDDGDPCTVDDRCTQSNGFSACVGEALPADDGNDCTEDVCSAGKVNHTNLTGTACAPDHPCAKVGVCAAGQCIPNDPSCACTVPGDCADEDPCTVDACGDDGLCAPALLDCDDGDPCTEDGCTAGEGCTHEPSPAVGEPEICNGADDDCDGLVDEGFPGLGAPCDGGDGDACAGGTLGCADGGVACVGDEPVDEACNGVDDDCDGLVDEDTPGLGEACDGDDEDACARGVLVCAEGGTACDEAGAGYAELCNGLDDDCDGDVDEGFAGLGDPCTPDAGASCGDGFVVCAPDEQGVACLSGAPGAETCNGVDDDCDGVVDPPGALGCLTWYRDLDGDEWGAGAGACLCAPTATFTTTDDGDCDDLRADVHPGGAALCGADGDCDGSPVDPGEPCDDGDGDPADGCHGCAIVPFTIAGAGSRQSPDALALPGGGFLVVWREGAVLRAARFDGGGEPAGDVIEVAEAVASAPRLARLSAGSSVVVWSDGVQARGRVLPDAGEALGSAAGVALGPVTPESNPVVARAGDGVVVAWAIAAESASQVRWRLVDAALAPLGDLEALEADGEARTPTVASTSGTAGFVLVAAVTAPGAAAGAGASIVGQLYDGAGQPTTPLVALAEGGEAPGVAGAGAGALVTWGAPTEGDDMLGRALLVDGSLGDAMTALPGPWLEVPRVTAHPAGGLIAAGVKSGDWHHVTVARADGTLTIGAAIAAPTVASWASRHPRVAAFADGGYLVVWEEQPWAGSTDAAILALRFNADDSLRYR